MDIKMLVRLGAVALVGVVAVVAVATFGDNAPLETDTRRLDEQPTDPLGPMLVRCVELGEAALRDAGCRKTWMENRRRFLGQEPRMQGKPVQIQGVTGEPPSSAAKDLPHPNAKTDGDRRSKLPADSQLGAK